MRLAALLALEMPVQTAQVAQRLLPALLAIVVDRLYISISPSVPLLYP